MSEFTVAELRSVVLGLGSIEPVDTEAAREALAIADRELDRIAAFRYSNGRLVPLSDQEYREQCARRAREWEGRDGDPCTALDYKPDWAKPGKPW